MLRKHPRSCSLGAPSLTVSFSYLRPPPSSRCLIRPGYPALASMVARPPGSVNGHLRQS
ncbi:hypothetical protein BC939DRAFT_441433 [Gamsiella multidivaricata]|uniref:uncharacterized protein n=1 Tax=Gamsiella multidivaricata TaxID=101098 RepID=UPI00221FD029|nr:uncharacterized protein BC939DRAFT_441433 [Gamsiella multidivaricata]KAI7829670.1 hypothetical protein BC939DRAFT_441433 [Gamsiella multidivaricata]